MTPRDFYDVPPPNESGDPWTADTAGAMQGILVGLALSIPVWAVIGWAVAFGPGWVLSSDWLWNGWCLR